MITRRRIGVFLKLVVSLALIWFLLDAVGTEDAFARLLGVDPSWLAAAAFLCLVQMVIGTLRWYAVLDAIDETLPIGQLFRITYIGGFFNQTLPSAAGGDAVRGYLGYKSGLTLGAAVNGLLLDRVATVLALMVLTVVMTPFAAQGLEEGTWFVRAVWIFLVLAIAGTATIMVLDRLPETLQRFRLIAGLCALAVDARRVLLHPWRGAWVMTLSLAGHANLSMVVFAIAQGLEVSVSIADCLLLFPPVLLAQTVPISLAGWGVREGAMVAMFALVGVSGESALVISILYGIVLALVSLPGAALWLSTGARAEDAEAFADSR